MILPCHGEFGEEVPPRVHPESGIDQNDEKKQTERNGTRKQTERNGTGKQEKIRCDFVQKRSGWQLPVSQMQIFGSPLTRNTLQNKKMSAMRDDYDTGIIGIRVDRTPRNNKRMWPIQNKQ